MSRNACGEAWDGLGMTETLHNSTYAVDPAGMAFHRLARGVDQQVDQQ